MLLVVAVFATLFESVDTWSLGAFVTGAILVALEQQ